MKALLRCGFIALIAALLHPVSAAPSLPEYNATEAAKHIGETARLVGMVDCIGYGRRHCDVQIGGCLPHTLLWVVVPNDVSGPELDCAQLRGVTIAVTGKIESPGGIPQVVVKSTEQIVPRTSPSPNYWTSANDKENKSDLDGAIADLDRAVELTHDPGTYIERAGVKEKKADFAGAIRDYDELIEQSADTNVFTRAEYYQSRAKLKIKKSDLDGAIADADTAIRLYSRSPWHYATRGQANEAKGNFVAAVNDYQMAIKTEPHNSIYKDMLKHAQAQAGGSGGGSSRPGNSPQSATALVTQAKAKLAAGDFDGAIHDCDLALHLTRGGSADASAIRLQAMKAKANPSAKSAQPVQTFSSPQPMMAMSTQPNAPVSQPKSAEVVDMPPAQADLGIKAGNIRVRFSDGHSEILTRTGNCMEPKVSPTGQVGWTQCSGFDRKGYALNQKLIIHLRNGVTKQFKANPNAPFIVAWSFVDNDSAVVIQSMSFHGPSSYIRYDLATERKTDEKAGRDDSEPLPEWARPVAKALPEYSPAVKGRDGDHASLPLAAQQTERVASTTEATSPQSPLAGTNILGSPAEPGIADVTALVEFTGNGSTNKGRLPNGLIFASDGNIYGTAERGGANDYGTIFKMTTAGALTTLIEFAGKSPANSSGMPRAALVEARDGNFYGTTSGGGFGPTGENYLDNGTVFKLSRSGVLTTLVRFSNNGPTNKGRDPYSPLVQGPTGDFYGTTFGGGSGKALPIPSPLGGFGTIYKMSPAGQLTTLFDFSAHIAMGEGKSPWSGLTLGRDGNFYGSTWNGLGVGGTIFKLTPKGAMTTLVKFSGALSSTKGGGCVAELVQASDGNFYGTTTVGGSGNRGTVFRMTPSGVLTTLVEFANNDSKGVEPHAALVEGSDGNLYGTTTGGGAQGQGTIFQVTPGGSFKSIWNFSNPNAKSRGSAGITGPLLKDKDGNFYGTTKWGGSRNLGTVFKLALNKPDTQASSAPPINSPAASPSQPGQSEQAQISPDQRDLQSAKQEFEQSSRDETARVAYVTKLAQIADRLVTGYRRGDRGDQRDELMGVINAELKKHPAPKDVDSGKLRQLLVGKWESPRHTYVFRANGKWGNEDGPVDTNWRVQGNQIVWGEGKTASRSTIIVLNSDFLIYTDRDNVFFHSRVKQ